MTAKQSDADIFWLFLGLCAVVLLIGWVGGLATAAALGWQP